MSETPASKRSKNRTRRAVKRRSTGSATLTRSSRLGDGRSGDVVTVLETAIAAEVGAIVLELRRPGGGTLRGRLPPGLRISGEGFEAFALEAQAQGNRIEVPLREPLKAALVAGFEIQVDDHAEIRFESCVRMDVDEKRVPLSLVGEVAFQVFLARAGALEAPEIGDHLRHEDQQGPVKAVHPNASGWIVQVGNG